MNESKYLQLIADLVGTIEAMRHFLDLKRVLATTGSLSDSAPNNLVAHLSTVREMKMTLMRERIRDVLARAQEALPEEVPEFASCPSRLGPCCCNLAMGHDGPHECQLCGSTSNWANLREEK